MVSKSESQKNTAATTSHTGRKLWNMAQKRIKTLSLEELEQLPRDAASKHNDYLYLSAEPQ